MSNKSAIELLREAIASALGSLSFPYHDIPTAAANNYITISNIRARETTAQTWFSFDFYVTVEILALFYKAGNRADAYAVATEVKEVIRPSITGAIQVPGYDVAGCWIDDEYEELVSDGAGKNHRIVLTYFFTLISQE